LVEEWNHSNVALVDKLNNVKEKLKKWVIGKKVLDRLESTQFPNKRTLRLCNALGPHSLSVSVL
jgi:hypothetical protein